MQALNFAGTTGAIVAVPAVAGQRAVLYGYELVLGGTTAPDILISSGATPLSPTFSGLAIGMVHSFNVFNSKEGFPIPRGVGEVGQPISITSAVGSAPTFRGTMFFDYTAA